MDESTVAEAVARGNPVVFLDISIGGQAAGRISLELFKGLCPRAAENFLALCCGGLRLRGAPVGYKGSRIHRVIPGFMLQGAQARRAGGQAGGRAASSSRRRCHPSPLLFPPRAGGDFVKGDGTGRACLWGDRFADEPAGLRARHAGPGLLAMANSGPDTNACQWYITLARAEHLDGRHVIFGRCLDASSLLVCKKIERIPTHVATGKPTIDIVVDECGEL